MKTAITINAILICFALFLFAYCFHRDCVKIDKGVAYVEYFKQGDILNPDYACPDTLIVVDAIGLNKAIAPIEQGKQDASDGNIAAIMYKYCKVK